ncbi:XerC Integrase [uncultured Caudovirales phage]|uniref:XerC Integrase n=1 Tax=uncultured Caudovirales phage TaxID=2100421 RepID=A0A6J5Q9P0_9CAUD|nr:XerC Integrase [uncultured Caudovirales phage]
MRQPIRPAKPSKPHKDYPLSAHANGQWCKKVRGKIHYFGRWDDPQAALLLWLREKDYLLSGVAPPGSGVKMVDVLNTVLEDRRLSVEAGDITRSHWNALRNMAAAIIGFLGKDSPAELLPQDWSRMRSHWAATLKPSSVAKWVANVRGMMTYAHGMEYIPAPKFGPAFVRPTQRSIREAASTRDRVVTREQYAAMLANADGLQRCCLLLALNLAYGQHDLATLTPDMVSPEGIVKHPRPKTGVRRWGALWPESLVMLGELFRRRVSENAIRWALDKSMVDGHTPYDLRHTFATVADQSTDSRAVDCVMGHSGGIVREGYQHGIDPARLRAVSEFVRSRML